MGYSGSATARQARENLAKALAALQEDPQIPPDVLAIAQNIAGAVGALFEAERASSEPDGKAGVKSALGSVSQTLALLQEVRSTHHGVQLATEAIAQTLGMLFPLSTQPSRMPPPGQIAVPVSVPKQAPVPNDATLRDEAPPVHLTQPTVQGHGHAPAAFTPASPAAQPRAHANPNQPREQIEINIGATTESNFYVGFSGEVSEGGVFAATYNILPKGTPVRALVTLPGGFDKEVLGFVRFVRDPMDMSAESEPGIGVQFESLDPEAREPILRFIRKRPPIFYDE